MKSFSRWPALTESPEALPVPTSTEADSPAIVRGSERMYPSSTFWAFATATGIATRSGFSERSAFTTSSPGCDPGVTTLASIAAVWRSITPSAAATTCASSRSASS